MYLDCQAAKLPIKKSQWRILCNSRSLSCQFHLSLLSPTGCWYNCLDIKDIFLSSIWLLSTSPSSLLNEKTPVLDLEVKVTWAQLPTGSKTCLLSLEKPLQLNSIGFKTEGKPTELESSEDSFTLPTVFCAHI